MEAFEDRTLEKNYNYDFFKENLETTMDISCPTWMDWFHGGLQFQVEHHFYPRLPRHQLRQCSYRLQEICKKHNMKYHAHSFY